VQVKLLEETISRIGSLDEAAMCKAQERLDNLAIPRHSLGRLTRLARVVAGITGNARPPFKHKVIFTMAGDHGVVEEGVSAFPQQVTKEMVHNFVRGGAAINVLARHVGARVVVVDMGTAADLGDLVKAGKIVSKKVAAGTRNFARHRAMTREQAVQAIEAGIRTVGEAGGAGLDLMGVGDMGIGNTTPSSAIIAAFSGRPAREVTGRGTGIDDATFDKKVQVIERALAMHKPDPADALDVLSAVGGFEIAGIAGAVLAGAARRVPVVIDGFIATAGAVVAVHLAPQVKDFIIASHRSVEVGHRVMLTHLGLHPLLDLDLRLGEGTGAALGISLVEASIKIMTEMLTFDEARVTEGRMSPPT
jgi:nicotinate-nucleotide--dimethylbenzimidazole phosphoribosyltransferase